MKNKPIAPFYIGEKVIAIDAIQGSIIKNGSIYEIYSCEYEQCNGNWYWYVGVIGSHKWLRPSIFAPLHTVELMCFEKINESTPIHAN
jgi:hypothetical protein